MPDQPYGLVATFDTPASLYNAAKKVRDAGYKHWDCITPFPIHGLDSAMGVRRSIVPRFSLVGGVSGFLTGMGMIYWTSAIEYPLIVGGKPFFSPLYAFPISYELTILFCAFATIFGMFVTNRLPMHYHPVMELKRITAALDDKFLIVIESRDPKFNAAQTQTLLESVGGQDVAEIEA